MGEPKLTKSIEIREAQEHFSELLAMLEEGFEVILTEDSTPRARISPIGKSAQQRVAGLHQGSIQASDDFDEQLPDEFWLGAK